DHVAVLDKPYRPADGRLRPDMANAEATCSTGKTSVRDQRHLAAHALTVERRRRRQHLAHARTAARPLVADDENLAFLVFAQRNRFEALLFRIEAARRAREFQFRHAGDL